MIRSLVSAASKAVAARAIASPDSRAQDPGPLRIGVLAFLRGPAAGPFGFPARNAADVLAEAFNMGSVVPGYEQKRVDGQPIGLALVDETGGPTMVVTERRNLMNRRNVDTVIGVITSADGLAAAPVAEEEMNTLTLRFDCSTNRIFEEAQYRYGFRTTTMPAQEDAAAARSVVNPDPEVRKFESRADAGRGRRSLRASEVRLCGRNRRDVARQGS